MQLNKKKKNVKGALLAASCSLLGGNAVAEDWNFDTALMYYGETDRVTAVEGIVSASKKLSNEREFSAKLVLDALTGASASGAVPQQTPQTFTRPSGNGQYTISAEDTPLDDTFRDTRVQIAAQYSQPLGENYIASAGTNLSREYDYQSIGFNGSLGRYFNNKNTTVSLGLSLALDAIDPVGGRPIGLSSMVVDEGQFASDSAFDTAFNATRQSGGDDTKNTVDAVFGITQVINRRWITQFNLSLSSVDGYLTDPFKVVSEVDSSGTTIANLYEHRPDSRSKQAIFAQSKYHFEHSIWDISLRFSDDDWGVQSQTFETRYRWLFDNGAYLEPHFRFYQQSEADFYTPFLLEGDALPEFASADYRIGNLDTYTVGIKYGRKLRSGREWGVRLEYYNQTPNDVGGEKPGQLNNLDLYPSLDALVVQFNYSF